MDREQKFSATLTKYDRNVKAVLMATGQYTSKSVNAVQKEAKNFQGL